MQAQLLRAARGLRLTAAQREARLRRVHFATQPALSVPGWLPRLLTDVAWLSPRRIVRATARDRGSAAEGVVARGLGAVPAAGAGGTPATDAHAGRSLQGSANRLKLLESGRLDAFYGWIPWALSGVSAPLAVAGTDCDWLPRGGGRASGGRGDAGRSSGQEAALPDGPPGSSLNGSVALITLTSLPGADPGWGSSSGGQLCSYGAMLAAAEAAGAAAVLFAAPPGASLALVNCTAPAECGTPVGLPASMVPHLVGEVLREAAEAGALVQLNFIDAQVTGRRGGGPGGRARPNELEALGAIRGHCRLGGALDCMCAHALQSARSWARRARTFPRSALASPNPRRLLL